MSCSCSRVDAVGFQNRGDGLRFGFEDGGHYRLVGSMSNCVGGSLVAQQQGESVNQDGLSGAGFAGQQVEAGPKLDGDVVNDRVVFDSQFQQHVSSRLAEVKRSVARLREGNDGSATGSPVLTCDR